MLGIPKETMHKDFRGECTYQAEVDVHFPQLTVGDTLAFAASARAPSNRIPGVSRKLYAEHMRDVIMAVFGLSHTINTKVGNDFIRVGILFLLFVLHGSQVHRLIDDSRV